MSCNHDCEHCSSKCGEQKCDPKSFLEAPNKCSHIRKVIGVVSGKGGVGKSMVTSLLAVSMQRKGYACAIMDADFTGPSIPTAFGMHENAMGSDEGIEPVVSDKGIRVMSLNLLLDDPTKPVVWRGPVFAGAVKQFWSDVVWGDVDYMFVDMPPGTGDVPLTVFQSIPVDGVVVVATPQELVTMIVEKSVNMAKMMNIPVVGLVENMSYFVCPKCGDRHEIFGASHVEEVAKANGIGCTARLPMDPVLAQSIDKGIIEFFEGDWLDPIVAELEK